jgi:glycosidase
MTGDKPDERLRTPMQWRPGRGLGFTTGRAWEAAQPDSETRTVDAQTGNPGSLLNLYRRLIHLRKSNDALAAGRLLPLTASSPAVAAYLRRDDEHVVLVVVNLGEVTLAAVRLQSAPGALAAGRYEPRDLLGSSVGETLTVGADGAMRDYSPIAGPFRPRSSVVMELARGR